MNTKNKDTGKGTWDVDGLYVVRTVGTDIGYLWWRLRWTERWEGEKKNNSNFIITR